jgi:Uma2 family endonuclease
MDMDVADGELGLLERYPGLPRRRLTVDEYYRMGEAGILARNERVELIEGELIEMAPIGSEHAGTVNKLAYALILAVGSQAVVSPQNPVRLANRTEPEPDFAVLQARADFYTLAHPTAQDVLLAIEVADSSLAYDSGLKRALYASRDIREFWIVNLVARVVEVYRNPSGDRYEWSATVEPSGVLEIEALPGVSISAKQIFG